MGVFVLKRDIKSFKTLLFFFVCGGGGGGGGGGGQGGQSLPLPVLRSTASRTFVPLCLPTPTLHCVSPVFRLIKRIRSPGLTFKLCQNLTLLFIFWPSSGGGIIGSR